MPAIGIRMGLQAQRPSSGGAPSLILDSLSAGAAYSTRKLRTAYAGAAIRVRRSSDNVEADIGFSGNALDTAALTAHVGANSGFVVTWYDQSGNARHVTQATAARQPRIVNAGTIDKLNGKPAALWDGTDDILANGSPFMYAAGAATIFLVHSLAASAAANVFFEGSSASATQRYQIRGGTAAIAIGITNDAGTIIRAVASIESNTLDSTAKVTAIRDNGSSVDGFKNGTLGLNTTYTRSGVLTLNRFSLNGADLNGTQNPGPAGLISEAIIFPASLSNTDFNAVGASQGAEYGITVNPI